MSLVSKEWSQVKKLRAERIGGMRCEICGETEGVIVGHHLISPKKQGGVNTAELCELRCRECEQLMHEQHTDGNRQKQKTRISRHKLS